MKINLASFKNQEGQQNQINPKDIFKVLPKKNKKYSYLRDVQAEVLDLWFEKKNELEIVIKMNTGSGKTIVSLLILESCLKQAKGPAVYVVPDNYLLCQVRKEAEDLGIETTEDPTDISFFKQKSILLINIHKMFNGRSVFGVGREGKKIDIGTILIDDAHACIDKLEDQFTISIASSDIKYKSILELFSHDLDNQSHTVYSDISILTPGAFLQVPFWTIQSHVDEINSILSKNLDQDESIKFKLPLLKEYLNYCDCVVSSERIEFSIRVIPTRVIPSYESARKIIVSATLPDDTILSRCLNIKQNAIRNTITPSSASDLGERLIIVPEEISPEIKKYDIKNMLEEYASKCKVVVIVPSKLKADYWSDVAKNILFAKNIEDGLETFHSEGNGIVVLVNKYDGIDLPDDECRILVIDELPNDRSEIERIDSSIFSGDNSYIVRKIRKIEQGMGRSIRSNDDYSIVFLLGKSLTNYLFGKNGIKYFTPATRKQIEVSSSILEQIHKGTVNDIKEAMDLLLTRDPDWVNIIKSSLLGLSFQPQIPNNISFLLREAFELSWDGQNDKAIRLLEEGANSETDATLKGFIKYYLAQLLNMSDATSAQVILKSALSINGNLVRPLEGIKYQKLQGLSSQAEKCKSFMMSFSNDPNLLLVKLNAVNEVLEFKPDSSNEFEEAIMELGKFLGFGSQRPEKEYGKGPDNLWSCGNLKFFVIECKNGCVTNTISKNDTNQINGSINWFDSEYDETCTQFPILIHPSCKFDYAASPNKKIRIIDAERLNKLKRSVYDFIVSCIQSGQIADLDKIKRALCDYKVSPDEIIKNYSISID